MSDGSDADVAGFLARAQGPLRGFLRGMLHDAELTRDLVQDVFCDAWRAVRRGVPPFDVGEDELAMRRWLFHTAYCRAVSARRRQHLIQWESLDDPALRGDALLPLAPHPFEDQVLESQVLQHALATLDAEEAACLLLQVVHSFTAVEIAQIVGISPAASKKRLSRAKQRLRSAYFAQEPSPQEPSDP